MRSKLLAQTLILTIAVVGLTGCKNGRWFWQKDPKATAGPGGLTGGTPVDHATGTRPDGTVLSDGTQGDFTPVYFDYDSSTIKPSEFSKLETIATALKGNSKKLSVEGHTDERGTAEYNRALGERRAQSARAALIKLGVAGTRLTTTSWGKDRPVDESHGDTAWSRNRRCEFVVTGQ